MMSVYLRPHPLLFWSCAALFTLIATIAWVFTPDGNLWALQAIIAAAPIMFFAGLSGRAVVAAGVPRSRWWRSCWMVGVAYSLLFALACTPLSMVKLDYFSSFITQVPGVAGDESSHWVLLGIVTFLTFFVSHLISTSIGATAAAVHNAYGIRGTATLLGAMVVMYLSCVLALSYILDRGTEITIPAPWPGVFLFGVPIILLAAAVSYLSARRIEP